MISENENLPLTNNETQYTLKIASIRDEFLSQIKKLEKETSKKFENQNTKLESSIIELSSKLNNIIKSNKELSNNYAEISVKLDKLNELEVFKRKLEGQIITHEIRLNNTIKDLSDAKLKYDKIFIDNLLVPGFIGPQAQFKTMGEYIHDNIITVTGLNSLKETSKKDLKEIKLKLDNIYKEFLTIINSTIQRCNDYSDNKNKILEDEFKLEIKNHNEKIIEVRMQNVKEAISLEKRTKEMENEWNNILNIKTDIEKKLSDNLLIYQNNLDEAINKYNDMKGEFNKIKMRFGSLVDFIKDIQSRKNIGTCEVFKKKEIKRLTDKLNFNKQNENSYNSSDLEKVDLDYEIKIEANVNTDDEEGDFEKKKKVRQIFRKLTDKKVNDYNNNNNINVNNNNMIDYNMKNMKYNYNRIKNEISDNINNVKIRGLNNLGRKSVNVNFYNENFNIKEVGDFLQKENKINIIASPSNNRRKKRIEDNYIHQIYINENKNLQNQLVIERKNVNNIQNDNYDNQISSSSQEKNEKIVNLKNINNNNNNNYTYYNQSNNNIIYNNSIGINNKKYSSTQLIDKSMLEKFLNEPSSFNPNYNNKNNNNNNIKQHKQINLKNQKVNHNKFNSISTSTNTKLSAINFLNYDSNIPQKKIIKTKKKMYIKNTPKDYDSGFGFNFIQLGLERKLTSQNTFLINNFQSERDIIQSRNDNNRISYSNNKNTNLIRSSSPSDYHKEFIDSEGNIVYRRNIKFNDILPSKKKNKINKECY